MIRAFFKEYYIWYLSYSIVSFLFLLLFLLYHLPLQYFETAVFVVLTVLSLVTLVLYLKFRQKILVLKYFSELKDLADFTSPSDQAYKQIIFNIKREVAEEELIHKNQREDWQGLIKMWSHQMKVPLAALSLMAQSNQLDSQEVRQQLLRLENYVNTLLSYLKFSQNKDDFRFEKCSTKAIMTELVKKYRLIFLHKNIAIQLDGDWEILSDKKWLTFALSQILDNAIKYTKIGGKVTVHSDARGIVISDNGIGILKEDLPRLFEEGFTGYNGHEHQKATGLGLYMTKQVLTNLNLDIHIDSQIDKGTQVTVYKKAQ